VSAVQNVARIDGPNLVLRLVTPEDAAYLHRLRTDPRYNQHLSAVSGSAEDQRLWIVAYKAREAEGRELYYIIERHDGTRCGTVRLYDITANSFTWGSWILDDNKPAKAALASALLVYEVGFERLGCTGSVFDVRHDNTRTLAFHRRFGAREIGADARDIYFDYTRDRFAADRGQLEQALGQGAF